MEQGASSQSNDHYSMIIRRQIDEAIALWDQFINTVLYKLSIHINVELKRESN